MTGEQLEQAGRLLFGMRYQADLTAFLGVNRKTTVAWVKGVHPVPRAAAQRVKDLLHARCNIINTLIAELDVKPEGGAL